MNLRNSSSNFILNNTIEYNDYGIVLDTLGGKTTANNLILGNEICDNYRDGIYIASFMDTSKVIYNNITKNKINYNQNGIKVWVGTGYFQFNNITENILINNEEAGIDLYVAYGYSPEVQRGDISYNYVYENKFSNCGLHFDASLDNLTNLYIDESNTVNGKTLYYKISQNNLLPGDFIDSGQIILVNCNNSEISGFNVSYSTDGIALYYCEQNNISINIANHNILNGILLHKCYNVTVYNNTLSYNKAGIYSYRSIKMEIHKNALDYNKKDGINLAKSKECNLTENTMKNCGLKMVRDTIGAVPPIEQFNSHYIDTSNGVNGKPIYYYVNKLNLRLNDFLIDGEAGQVFLISCNDSIISDLDLSSSSMGLLLFNSRNNTISNITASYNLRSGIIFEISENNTVRDCEMRNNEESGILSWDYSHNNTIKNNLISNNKEYGIRLHLYCNNNTIIGNSLINNTYGFFAQYVEGLWLYNNNFTNNIEYNAQVIFGTYLNFDNGEVGNFWDDYAGADLDDDGIGDAPHNFESEYVDNLPIWIDGIDLQGGVIKIDGQFSGVGANNWSWALDRYWCSGSGTLKEPFIIKDLIIDGHTTEICIEIINSDVYFIIQDCILYNSSNGNYDAAIKLDNVNNGTLINNRCENNKKYGICLYDCYNITISNNTFSTNDGSGLYLENSNNNTISFNFANNNVFDGIKLTTSNNNTILENTVNQNGNNGITIYKSYNNTIVNNTETISNNDNCGIYLELSDFNYIINNDISNNLIGIHLNNSNYNTVMENDITGNGQSILSTDCIFNWIFNNYYGPSGGALGAIGGDDGDGGKAVEQINLIIIFIIIGIVVGLSAGGFYAVKKIKSQKYPSEIEKKPKILRTKEIVKPEEIKEPIKPKKVKKPVKPKKVKKLPKTTAEVAALSEAEKEKLARTESEVDVHREKFVCVVHKGPITGTDVYICPKCNTFYCVRCAKALREKGDACWSCGSEISVVETKAEIKEKTKQFEKKLTSLKTTVKNIDKSFYSGAISQEEYAKMKDPLTQKIASILSEIKKLKK